MERPAIIDQVLSDAANGLPHTKYETEVLRAYIESLERDAAPWQPIETAPTDGSWCLVAGQTFRTDGGAVVCRWDGRCWQSSDDGYQPYIEPTYWRPLPALPAIDAAIARRGEKA